MNAPFLAPRTIDPAHAKAQTDLSALLGRTGRSINAQGHWTPRQLREFVSIAMDLCEDDSLTAEHEALTDLIGDGRDELDRPVRFDPACVHPDDPCQSKGFVL